MNILCIMKGGTIVGAFFLDFSFGESLPKTIVMNAAGRNARDLAEIHENPTSTSTFKLLMSSPVD